MNMKSFPSKQGLYDPRFEHDACGIGFVVNIKGEKSNRIVREALSALKNLSHRGGLGSEPTSGDGAGISVADPPFILYRACARQPGSNLPEAGDYGTGLVFLPHDPSVGLSRLSSANLNGSSWMRDRCFSVSGTCLWIFRHRSARRPRKEHAQPCARSSSVGKTPPRRHRL